MHPSAAEPYLPAEGIDPLETLAFDLALASSRLAGQLHPITQQAITGLVRSMNCYYSNLIEGHNTHPRDIDRALAADYSDDLARRDLQLEARAHIEVQQLVDAGAASAAPAASRRLVTWIHREFCSRLPEGLLWVENPDTHEQLRVTPGEMRTRDVIVGLHVPPPPADVPAFLDRFEEAYAGDRLSKPRRAVAVAAAHHRLLWIHPFLDGNGRVARLMSHAMLLELGLGSSLWSVSRGLAQRSAEYKRLLMAADTRRRDDRDGRGSLSQTALVEFCRFFLETCLDQVTFMGDLLQISGLLGRIEAFVREEEQARRLPRRSFAVLREVVLSGEVPRSDVARLVDMSERTARRVSTALIGRRLLVSPTPRGPLRLGVPVEVVEHWFPRLYPG